MHHLNNGKIVYISNGEFTIQIAQYYAILMSGIWILFVYLDAEVKLESGSSFKEHWTNLDGMLTTLCGAFISR